MQILKVVSHCSLLCKNVLHIHEEKSRKDKCTEAKLLSAQLSFFYSMLGTIGSKLSVPSFSIKTVVLLSISLAISIKLHYLLLYVIVIMLHYNVTVTACYWFLGKHYNIVFTFILYLKLANSSKSGLVSAAKESW